MRDDLKGEISNLKFHQSGMLFFTLKDDLASVACAMSADDAQRLATMPFDGMRVIVSGSVGLYARSGRYQFYASSLRSDGLGTLYERLMRLKSKLSEEGLFDQEKKKPVPGDVDTVGVVSSPTGAAMLRCGGIRRREFCSVLRGFRAPGRSRRLPMQSACLTGWKMSA